MFSRRPRSFPDRSADAARGPFVAAARRPRRCRSPLNVVLPRLVDWPRSKAASPRLIDVAAARRTGGPSAPPRPVDVATACRKRRGPSQRRRRRAPSKAAAAAIHIHGLSTWHPRRRREAPPRNVRAAVEPSRAATSSLRRRTGRSSSGTRTRARCCTRWTRARRSARSCGLGTTRRSCRRRPSGIRRLCYVRRDDDASVPTPQKSSKTGFVSPSCVAPSRDPAASPRLSSGDDPAPRNIRAAPRGGAATRLFGLSIVILRHRRD